MNHNKELIELSKRLDLPVQKLKSIECICREHFYHENTKSIEVYFKDLVKDQFGKYVREDGGKLYKVYFPLDIKCRHLCDNTKNEIMDDPN